MPNQTDLLVVYKAMTSDEHDDTNTRVFNSQRPLDFAETFEKGSDATLLILNSDEASAADLKLIFEFIESALTVERKKEFNMIFPSLFPVPLT